MRDLGGIDGVEKLYQDLHSTANAQKKKGLATIYEILKEMRKNPAVSYTVAEVARRSQAAGGPREQTIRNKSGADYRLLIETYRENHVQVRASSSKPPGALANRDSDLLRKISDPALRAVMGGVVAERNSLRNQLNLLKSNANVTIDMRAGKSGQDLIPSIKSRLTGSEVIALTHAISDEKMAEEGWIVTKHGGVRDSTGRGVFKPGFTAALKKVLEDASSS